MYIDTRTKGNQGSADHALISQLSGLQIDEKTKPSQPPTIPYHFDASTCDPFVKYYVVTAGRKTGIFDDWIEAQKSYQTFPSGQCKSYKSLELAREAWLKHSTGTEDKPAQLSGKQTAGAQSDGNGKQTVVGEMAAIGGATPSVTARYGGSGQQNPGGDNESYWVVSRGEHPGVYRGNDDTIRHGIGSATAGFVRRFDGAVEANAAFVLLYMTGGIVATSE